MPSGKCRLMNSSIILYAIAFMVLLFRAPIINFTFSYHYILLEAGILLIATCLTVIVALRMRKDFFCDFGRFMLSPKKNLAFPFMLCLFSASLLLGAISLFKPAYSSFASIFFLSSMAYVPIHSLFLILVSDPGEYICSLGRDIDSELQKHKKNKKLPSIERMKLLTKSLLSRKDYGNFCTCNKTLFSIAEKRKGKKLVAIYRCLKEISLECINDSRAQNLFLRDMENHYDSVFKKGLLPHARIVSEFYGFVALKALEEFNISSSSAAVAVLGKVQSSLVSAKQQSSSKSIGILGHLAQKALLRGYPTLLSATLEAFGKISMQCVESENISLLEKSNQALSRMACISFSKGRKDIVMHILRYLSTLGKESYKNPKFFSIVWNVTDCLFKIGMEAVKFHEEEIVEAVASLLKATGVKCIRGYISGEKEDVTPARYAIRKLKIMKRELERERMNTIFIEKAIWDIANAARF